MSAPTPIKELQGKAVVKEQLKLDYGESGDERPIFSDPAFMENREVPVHRWVPWIAGFSATFVDDCLRAYMPSSLTGRRLVLDPFAGVGTTLISALRSGHNAVGFEINPYAALACRAKVEAIDLDLTALNDAIAEYSYASKNGSRTAKGSIPDGFVSRIDFFSPRVEEQVYGFLSFLKGMSEPPVSDLFKIAFGSVMVSFSNYTYEPSLSTRPGAGKPLIEDADVHGAILSRLRKMAEDTKWLQSRIKGSGKPVGQVHTMSFMDSDRVLDPGSIALAVTSPPYLNNYHYVRSTRPHLYWLGLVESSTSLKELENQNVGKYWQTVRGKKPISLQFEDPALEATLDSIRQTRTDKGVYGGGGWANYVASYFNDSDRFLSSLSQAMASNGVAVIVIGNSIIQGHEIKVEEVLGRIARRHGFEIERIETLRTKRVGASITKSAVRRGESSSASLNESALIIRRGTHAL